MESRKDWYLGHKLIIEQDKIYYNQPVFIMMDWEDDSPSWSFWFADGFDEKTVTKKHLKKIKEECF